MRVLFLAPQPFYRLRGMCIAQKTFLEALGRMGARVDVLTYPFGEDVKIPGVRVLRLPRLPGMRDIPIGPSWQKAAMAPVMLLAALVLLARRRYDMVHACEESALLLAPLKALRGFRLVYDMDDVLSARLARSGFCRSRAALKAVEALERRALRAADLVLTNSRDTTEYARRFTPPGRVHFYDHAPPLLDEARWTPSQRRDFRREHGLEDRRVILYAGNLEEYQGIQLLLESLPSVFRRLPDAVCVIIGGEPAQVEKLRLTARRRGLGERVTVLGQRPLSEAFRFMRAADVLVSPMTQEKAVPMKLYAYLAACVPIVATNLLNHTQLLDGNSALLPSPDPDSFGAAICAELERVRPDVEPVADAIPRRWDGDAMTPAIEACWSAGLPVRA